MGDENMFPSEGPDFGDVLSGAGGGAAAGFTLGGPVGGVIGGIAGLAAGLFGPSESEVRRRRAIQQLRLLRENRKRALSSTAKLVGDQGAGMMSAAAGGAKARALREGRTDASGDIAVAEQGIASKFSPILANSLENINQRYDQSEEKLGMDYASSPIQPNAAKSLLTLGESMLKVKQNNDYLKTMRGSGVTQGDVSAIQGMSTGVGKPDINQFSFAPMQDYEWEK
jgi:gas vesicle protein